jgi:RNA polymerase-interacting CarD/CdnL/TRCF family regulator
MPKEALMDFRVGDPVVHWSHGIGEIIGLEERTMAGKNTLYYVVKIQEITIWVPADDKVLSRLRVPTSEHKFMKLFAILSGPGASLSDNRLERKTQLHKGLADGKVETLCHVIRDLTTYALQKPLNENDKDVLERAQNLLVGEWKFSLSIPRADAEIELGRLLGQPTVNIVNG